MTDGSAGFDLTASTEGKITFIGDIAILTYGTGLAVEIPVGHVGLIFPRSSVTAKTTLMLGNCVGVIDSDYRGEITFQFKDMGAEHGIKYNKGDRIGQLIIMPVPNVSFEEVKELTDTTRGAGAMGSTGVK